MSRSVGLTTNADTILPADDALIVNAVQQTLNPNDSLDAGGGFDTLALAGSGTFDLGNLLNFAGFEAVTLTNETTTAATLRLRNGIDASVAVGRGNSAATTDADGNPLINVYLATGSNRITAGAENDAFYAAPTSLKPGDGITAGAGFDSLNFTGGTSYDLRPVALSGIEGLVVTTSTSNPTSLYVNSADLVDVTSVNTVNPLGYGTTNLITSDASLDLGNLLVLGSIFRSNRVVTTITTTNTSGTTFHVTGTNPVPFIIGGGGSDTIVSDTVIPFATREAALSRSIETVTDPSGSYGRLVSITTPDESINTGYPRINGTVDASATGLVSLYNDSNLVGTAAIQADHTWGTNVGFRQDGVYTLQAQVGDAAGDVGTSNALHLTIDTSPPVVSVTTLGGDVINRYVTLAGSAVTQSASGIDPLGEVGDTVQVYERVILPPRDPFLGPTLPGVLLGSGVIDGTGHWSLGVELLGAGSHTLVARVIDAAGNSGYSNNVTFNALAAGPGNDTLAAGPGNSILDGGAGDDTVVLPFALTQAALSYDAAGRTVLDGPGGVREVLSNFEHFRFTDGTVNERAGSPLVDDLFYFIHNPDVWNAHVDATAHYAVNGWHEGRDPNAYFSTTGYLAANPDVRAAGLNPLTHYDTNGWREGRDPSANFDDELYRARNPDVAAAGVDPLQHYLTNGQAEGRQAYAAIGRLPDIAAAHGFDAEYYLLNNPDVARAAITAGGDSFAFALQHYQANGWHEGRNPNAVFDVNGYLNAYADVRAANVDPLAHYDIHGWHEGRDPSASFDTRAYESHYGDVAAVGVDPMQHYLTNGIYEGRSAFADGHFA